MPDKVFIYDYFELKGQDIQAWHDTFFWPRGQENDRSDQLGYAGHVQ